MATIKDVAARAGVSVNTTSRVLNNRGYLSEETIRKVHKAMEELDYQPSAIARALVTHQTKLIGVLVPSISHPFFAACLDALERYASRKGYRLLVCNSLRDNEKEQEYIDSLRANNVAGVVISTRSDNLLPFLGGMPAVTFERVLGSGIPAIMCDNNLGGRLAAEELCAKGCQHPAIITGSPKVRLPADARSAGFAQACAEHQVIPLFYSTEEADFKHLDYTLAISRLFYEHPECDGIFATSDVIGAQCIRYCVTHGRRVPEDVKIVGFDDLLIASLTTPPLTTIHQPVNRMCKALIDTLDDLINHKTVQDTLVFPVEITRRQST